MKKIFFLILLAFTGSFNAIAQHNFEFHVSGLSDTTVYLANYFGGKMYYNDTTTVDKNGVIKFKGEDTKPGGIYAVIFPDNKTYFQVVVNEEKIEMHTTLENPEANMVVKVSDENKAFYEYLGFVTATQKKMKTLMAEKEAAKDKTESTAKLKAAEIEADKFKSAFLKKNASLFAIKVLKTSEEITVPEFKGKDGKLDDNKRFAYYHDHYFDNVDLSDDRLLRTPVLNGKIEYFLDKLTPQSPDSICGAIQYLTAQTRDTSLIYKYIIQYATNTYEKSKIMGMDAVFVCIAENYYAKDKAYWLDEEKTTEILDMYNARKNLIVGKKAENIVLMDTSNVWHSLYDVKSKYTVVVFWDPNCGHCKKEMPKLKTFYEANKNKGVEVFSVSTDFENEDWVAYVKENKLPWINVSDNPEINKNAQKYILEGKTTLNSLNFRDYWDIFSTPQFYLLDENKMIIAKRLNAEQIEGFIEQYEKRKAEGL